jgi:hypothetical protein
MRFHFEHTVPLPREIVFGFFKKPKRFIEMAWTCLANDLIWWVPFALILACALGNQRRI